MIFWVFSSFTLIFLSKLSFAAVGVPSQISVFIYQHGLHPYLNVLLSFILALPILLFQIIKGSNLTEQSKIYKSLLACLLGVFFVQTLLRNLFLDHGGALHSWIVLGSSFWAILTFGVLIPKVLSPATTVRFISSSSLFLVLLSLVLWMCFPALSFKGGRFVGVFKHIPYMVTCASVAVVFTLGRLNDEKNLWPKSIYVCGILLSLLALILTGTRSALAAAIMALGLWLFRFKNPSAEFRFFKYSAILVLLVTMLLFGAAISQYAIDVATGRKSLMEREAQNGVASRIEEVERGWGLFQNSPWLGQGLLAKFSGKEGFEISSYNSFRDPHNIFVSAGVVGGWPFIIWTVVFLVFLVLSAKRALSAEDSAMQILAIYALVQFPILIIYHWHLSLGGMADRFYWLIFGYLALKEKKPGI